MLNMHSEVQHWTLVDLSNKRFKVVQELVVKLNTMFVTVLCWIGGTKGLIKLEAKLGCQGMLSNHVYGAWIFLSLIMYMYMYSIW